MKTYLTTITIFAMLVTTPISAFAEDCGVFCPNQEPIPEGMEDDINDIFWPQMKQMFVDGYESNYTNVTNVEAPNDSYIDEWHSAHFSIEINVTESAKHTLEGADVYVNSNIRGTVDCFFDSSYQWKCRYRNVNVEFIGEGYGFTHPRDSVFWGIRSADDDFSLKLFFHFCFTNPKKCDQEKIRRLNQVANRVVPPFQHRLLDELEAIANEYL